MTAPTPSPIIPKPATAPQIVKLEACSNCRAAVSQVGKNPERAGQI
jgi:hypothetical protein